jgi:uncharacterized protein with HEPN domain
MLDALLRIASYTKDMAVADFLNDNKTQDAVIRNLEIIGEACSNVHRVSPKLVAKHPEVPWGSAIGNRNALVHGYFSVDMQLVWNTLKHDLPAFELAIRSILNGMSDS